jgi:hypothetical protein
MWHEKKISKISGVAKWRKRRQWRQARSRRQLRCGNMA